jgi:hypothetical protein
MLSPQCTGGIEKNHKNLRIANLQTKIQTEHLLNTSLVLPLHQPARRLPFDENFFPNDKQLTLATISPVDSST